MGPAHWLAQPILTLIVETHELLMNVGSNQNWAGLATLNNRVPNQEGGLIMKARFSLFIPIHSSDGSDMLVKDLIV